MKILLVMFSLAVSSVSFGGAKENFVAAVKEQCKVDDGTAGKQVTPGRTGTVVQFKLCNSGTVELPNGCVLTCTRGGAKVGG